MASSRGVPYMFREHLPEPVMVPPLIRSQAANHLKSCSEPHQACCTACVASSAASVAPRGAGKPPVSMAEQALRAGGPVEVGPGPGEEPPRKRLRHEEHEVRDSWESSGAGVVKVCLDSVSGPPLQGQVVSWEASQGSCCRSAEQAVFSVQATHSLIKLMLLTVREPCSPSRALLTRGRWFPCERFTLSFLSLRSGCLVEKQVERQASTRRRNRILIV
jgi:hypothetical protein